MAADLVTEKMEDLEEEEDLTVATVVVAVVDTLVVVVVVVIWTSGGGGGSYNAGTNATKHLVTTPVMEYVKIVFLPNDEGRFISLKKTILTMLDSLPI